MHEQPDSSPVRPAGKSPSGSAAIEGGASSSPVGSDGQILGRGAAPSSSERSSETIVGTASRVGSRWPVDPGDRVRPVDYSHLSIVGCPRGELAAADRRPEPCATTRVDTSAFFGHLHPVRMRVPVFTAPLGTGETTRKHWDSLAIGAAISGISVVVGENVCGIDPRLETGAGGAIQRAPDLERRIRVYREWQDQQGDIVLQLNAEDVRLGVAEHAVEQLGIESIELKWGRAAPCVESAEELADLGRAIELRKRGYAIAPDPTRPAIQEAFRAGAFRRFWQHSRLGFVDEETFLRDVEYLRKTLGVKRVLLSTGAHGFHELALAIKWSSRARVDLVTIDASGAASPDGRETDCRWTDGRGTDDWGVPAFYLQCMAYECCKRLDARGEWIPGLAVAGDFGSSELVFKSLALGAPYFKAVRLASGIYRPVILGDRLEESLEESGTGRESARRPDSLRDQDPDPIFAGYAALENRLGRRVDDLPLGAMAMYTSLERLEAGLGRLMAGARSFRVGSLEREDLLALTEECARISGIRYVMDADRERAMAILDGAAAVPSAS